MTEIREPVEPVSYPVPDDVFDAVDADARQHGGAWKEPEAYIGSVGRTMFDTPSSDDNTVTVVVPRDSMEQLPSQSLVRILSVPDEREYLGVVVKGPFAEPDGLRGDAPIIVTTTVKGGIFMPRFHGRVEVQILGERLDGAVVPPRFRPLPNSPVFALDQESTRAVLRIDGEIPLGRVIGHDNLEISIPSHRKSVLPRHMGILGTTGGGKSTTVAGLIAGFQADGIATILVDTEGEYTEISRPTDDPNMIGALRHRGSAPSGIPNTTSYGLVGRAGRSSGQPFTLIFSQLSPYLVCEILDLNEAQTTRYMKAYDICKRLLRQFHISPTPDELGTFLEPDEVEEGYPHMTLHHMVDVVRACAQRAAGEDDPLTLTSGDFKRREEEIRRVIRETKGLDFPSSWRVLQGRLARLARLEVFDNHDARPLNYATMIEPGSVSIIDLSQTDSPQLNNLVIAEVLRGIGRVQNARYTKAEDADTEPPRTMIIIEEAHEFLSTERIKQMPHLFQQVARISRRGRKRWLGLVFVTQLPQHLPDEVLGLVNNYILHKIGDAGVIAKLKRSVSDVDESLWTRLPSLAPGQAIVYTPNMARPLMVAVNPAPCKLRMVD